MRQRSVSFDVLKGIAVLLVILGHVFRTSLRGAPSVIEDVIYSIHMPLFVLVTGYFATRPIHWTIKGVFSFWRTKVLRLLLPLLFIAEIAQIADEGAISLPLRSMVGGYWFTYALFMIFVVFFLVQGLSHLIVRCYTSFFKGKEQSIQEGLHLIVLLLSIPAIELFIAYLYTVDSRLCNRFVLYKVAHLYKYLLLGYFLGSYPRIEAYVRNELAGVIGFFSFVALFVAQRLYAPFPGQEVLMTLAGLVFIYSSTRGVITEQVEDQAWVRALAYLGRVSLAVYFLHYFFLPDLPLLRSYEHSILGDPIAHFAFQALLGVLMTAIILIPTLLLIRITRSNSYLRFFLYGETLPRTE